METKDELLDRAIKARRLASQITDERTVAALLDLAANYESLAKEQTDNHNPLPEP